MTACLRNYILAVLAFLAFSGIQSVQSQADISMEVTASYVVVLPNAKTEPISLGLMAEYEEALISVGDALAVQVAVEYLRAKFEEEQGQTRRRQRHLLRQRQDQQNSNNNHNDGDNEEIIDEEHALQRFLGAIVDRPGSVLATQPRSEQACPPNHANPLTDDCQIMVSTLTFDLSDEEAWNPWQVQRELWENYTAALEEGRLQGLLELLFPSVPIVILGGPNVLVSKDEALAAVTTTTLAPGGSSPPTQLPTSIATGATTTATSDSAGNPKQGGDDSESLVETDTTGAANGSSPSLSPTQTPTQSGNTAVPTDGRLGEEAVSDIIIDDGSGDGDDDDDDENNDNDGEESSSGTPGDDNEDPSTQSGTTGEDNEDPSTQSEEEGEASNTDRGKNESEQDAAAANTATDEVVDEEGGNSGRFIGFVVSAVGFLSLCFCFDCLYYYRERRKAKYQDVDEYDDASNQSSWFTPQRIPRKSAENLAGVSAGAASFA